MALVLAPFVSQTTASAVPCSGSAQIGGGSTSAGLGCRSEGSAEGGGDGGGSGSASAGGPPTYYVPICDSGQSQASPVGTIRCSAPTVECGDDGVAAIKYTGDENQGVVCVEPGEDGEGPAAPVITPGMILEAFERMPLPDSDLTLQPPGGETLVNFDTIFSTSNEPETTTVTLLGQSLDLEASATSYEWHHGDGSTQTTDWEGQPFSEGVPMSRYISYRYQDAFETVEPSVDTTWSARYRLNGGPWQPVAGTVTIEGDPASLRVVEGQPNLVG